MKNIIKIVIRIILKIPNNPIKNAIRDVFYSDIVSERIVEYPLVFAYLNYKGTKEARSVLDVGCYYSSLPIQLSSMGFKVTGVDLNTYELSHPNFKFIKSDIRELKLKSRFDIIISISTVEHIGIGYYGDFEGELGDISAVNRMFELLKKSGFIMVTVPYGKYCVTDSYRSYDDKHLKELFSNFKKVKCLYFADRQGKWERVNKTTVDKVNNSKAAKGIVFVFAKK